MPSVWSPLGLRPLSDDHRARLTGTQMGPVPVVSEPVLAFGLEEAEAGAGGVGDAGDSPEAAVGGLGDDGAA